MLTLPISRFVVSPIQFLHPLLNNLWDINIFAEMTYAGHIHLPSIHFYSRGGRLLLPSHTLHRLYNRTGDYILHPRNRQGIWKHIHLRGIQICMYIYQSEKLRISFNYLELLIVHEMTCHDNLKKKVDKFRILPLDYNHQNVSFDTNIRMHSLVPMNW